MILTKSTPINIILPTGTASEPEKFAALEAAKYLSKICGADCKVTDKMSESGVNILIGSPIRNKYTAQYITAEEFTKLCPGREGIFIKAADERYYI